MVKQQLKNRNKNEEFSFKSIQSKYMNLNYVLSLLKNPSNISILSVGILIIEFFLNIWVVQNVKYTEIDWKAYMQECEGFLNGTTNYALLRGDTGPLVYPAGFVYFYSILYFLTSHGQNVRLAQYIFIGIYLLQMFFVFKLYAKSQKVPPYILILTTFTSYRIHSIYVLRLFNDPVAILLLYISVNYFCNSKWTVASIFFSLAVSIKMNILLFAPAILLIYIVNLGYLKTFVQLFICGFVQIILALPFILNYPMEYINGSFDFGRIFEHRWTVNYRFLPTIFFQDKSFHFILLFMHVTLLAIFFKPCYVYVQSYCRLRNLQMQLQPQIHAKNTGKNNEKKNKQHKNQKAKELEKPLTDEQQQFLNSFENTLKSNNSKNTKVIQKPIPSASTTVNTEIENKSDKYQINFDKTTQLIILPIFLVNFIGIMCARSLHYQFYVWYFHSLPYLIWCTNYQLTLKLLLLGLIEYSWNTYPSTDFSSFTLHVSHVILLIGLAKNLLSRKWNSIPAI